MKRHPFTNTVMRHALRLRQNIIHRLPLQMQTAHKGIYSTLPSKESLIFVKDELE